ncbi:Mov34/MPN/PAD-1 family protein [Polyangium sorediatum]|uniref:Mov34/MPN/PAD-1 family protein n=1 Tax=Polyangium sorediatum TaxID=889274 RepID=A0ABT6NXE7_9BACT|nr:Mov34/MPN/PAD-1 family protein [Polyangium sorediatum]MDI1432740.1 Mov34/MPN/PAD-1 family protein [Polyangium sorediatum]
MVTDAPWTRGDLTITRSALAVVEKDALRGYAADEEACGYLRGPAESPLRCDEAVVMQNVANKLHAIDPELYFRTARTFFSFNEKKFDDAVRAAAREGRPVKILYHSHLDAGAYFSPTDAAVMSMGEPPAEEGGAITMGPGPAWPLAFLVTSVRDGVIDEHRLFVWDAERRSFVGQAITVVEE